MCINLRLYLIAFTRLQLLVQLFFQGTVFIMVYEGQFLDSMSGLSLIQFAVYTLSKADLVSRHITCYGCIANVVSPRLLGLMMIRHDT